MLTHRIIKSEISGAESDQPLIQWLCTRFTYHSLTEWTNLIRENRVRINEQDVTPDVQLTQGDIVSYLPLPHSEPDIDSRFRILWEDEHLLVIEKPANLPCHPAGVYFKNTLWYLLKCHNYETIKLIHRIDRETSGLVVAAKDKETAAILSKHLQSDQTLKRYNVIVEGKFEQPLLAEGWVGKDPDSVVRKKRCFHAASPVASKNTDDANWQKSGTELCPEKYVNGMSLVKATLITGRHHQIRATMQGLGFPVVGDKIYGWDERLFIAFIENTLNSSDRVRLRLDRQALHACELAFVHPHSAEHLRITSPLPADMQGLVTP